MGSDNIMLITGFDQLFSIRRVSKPQEASLHSHPETIPDLPRSLVEQILHPAKPLFDFQRDRLAFVLNTSPARGSRDTTDLEINPVCIFREKGLKWIEKALVSKGPWRMPPLIWDIDI